MKKLTAFLFAVMSIFVLAGCNSQSEEEKQDGTTDVKGGEPEFGWNVNPDSLPVVYRAFFVRDEKRWLETITFEDNGTFELYAEGISLYQGELERLTEDEQKKIIQELTKSDCKYTYVGTYTGDATKSGEICLSFKEKEGSSYNANQINLDGAVWNINIEYCNWFILPEEKADENYGKYSDAEICDKRCG